jgi:neutral ceramidase
MKVQSLFCGLVALLTLVLPSPVRAGEFKAGASAVVITPPIGTPLAGSYAIRRSNGVFDDLYAKAIVVEQDRDKVALVALDLGYTIRPVVTAARQLIGEQCRIAADRVMIAATHTHSGPVQTRDNLMDKITGADEPIVREFTAKLPVLIARAVAEANAKLTPARASALMSHEDQISFNRRYWMKDGTLGWMTARSPNMLRPAGPIDSDVGVCCLESTAKGAAPLAVYFNFAMHPTVVGGPKFSADYCGRVARRLAEYKGADMVTLFANGCCGNVNQINPNWANQGGGLPEAERIGTVLAAGVLRDWPKLQPLKTFAPRSRSTLVTLPRRKITDDEVAEARRDVDLIGKKKQSIQSIPLMANAVCILDTYSHQDSPLAVEAQAIAFSDDLAVVALPGEIFVELGLALKKVSPFKYTFIAELANGSIGYIPNRSAYPEGNYEVVSARCAQGSGEMLVDAALEILRALKNQQTAK